MIDHFYMFSDLNRDGKTWTLEDAFGWRDCKIISMGDDEDAYLFSMQLMIGEANIIPFQKFHDDGWGNQKETGSLIKYMGSDTYFCSDPRFLDYMTAYNGDLIWQKNQREKAHWSQPTAQHSWLKGFI